MLFLIIWTRVDDRQGIKSYWPWLCTWRINGSILNYLKLKICQLKHDVNTLGLFLFFVEVGNYLSDVLDIVSAIWRPWLGLGVRCSIHFLCLLSSSLFNKCIEGSWHQRSCLRFLEASSAHSYSLCHWR